jgi:hypothetical protein
MEVGATIAKTFKRFTIPRSTSSMGSFTASNGTASNTEQNSEETTRHKHPPLSYVQHFRPVQQHYSQQNLTVTPQQQKYALPTRPLSGDISSFMTRSGSSDFHPSANEYVPKNSRVNKSNIIQFLSFFTFLAESIH